jgi:hypothetical protein
VRPTHEEVKLAEQVRTALRYHAGAVREDSDVEDFIETAIAMTEKVRHLRRSVQQRICNQEISDRSLCPFIGGETLAATMVASLLGIEYELRAAKIIPKTGDQQGLMVWGVMGQATDEGKRRGPGCGWSESFDRADVNASESQFLIAACRAFVEAIECVLPFRPEKATRVT